MLATLFATATLAGLALGGLVVLVLKLAGVPL
jgi:hypothetical protein